MTKTKDCVNIDRATILIDGNGATRVFQAMGKPPVY